MKTCSRLPTHFALLVHVGWWWFDCFSCCLTFRRDNFLMLSGMEFTASSLEVKLNDVSSWKVDFIFGSLTGWSTECRLSFASRDDVDFSSLVSTKRDYQWYIQFVILLFLCHTFHRPRIFRETWDVLLMSHVVAEVIAIWFTWNDDSSTSMISQNNKPHEEKYFDIPIGTNKSPFGNQQVVASAESVCCF